jgi:putative sigma-54 modulation protein
MRISIEANQIEIPENLEAQIRTKVEKLGHYFNNIIDAIVFLHTHPKHKEIEIKLNVPNDILFVRDQGDTWNEALDIAYDHMKRQLQRYKGKTLKVDEHQVPGAEMTDNVAGDNF